MKDFPRSCLARFYLAFSTDDTRQGDFDAKRYLREALAVVDVEKTTRDWSEEHPEFCALLVDVVGRGIARADEFVYKYDKDDPARELELDSELRLPGYGDFRQALELAEKLDSTSLKTQHLLAKTDAVFGDYQKSYERVSAVIDSLLKESEIDTNFVFYSRHLRGRIAFLLVEQQRQRGDKMTEQTVELLERAVLELERCSKVLNAIGSNSAHVMKAYRVVHDHLRATLNLAEVEMDLQRPDEAGLQLKSSTELMATLKKKARLAGLDVSAFASLNRRLEDAYERHRRTERIASRSL